MMNHADTTSRLFSEVGMILKSRLQKSIAMPYSQCQALWFVAEHTSPSMQDIARYFKIRAPSATFLIEELVRGGYLARSVNPKDRRKVELFLTAKGKRVYKEFETKRAAVFKKIFGSLEEKDRSELSRILQKVIDSD